VSLFWHVFGLFWHRNDTIPAGQKSPLPWPQHPAQLRASTFRISWRSSSNRSLPSAWPAIGPRRDRSRCNRRPLRRLQEKGRDYGGPKSDRHIGYGDHSNSSNFVATNRKALRRFLDFAGSAYTRRSIRRPSRFCSLMKADIAFESAPPKAGIGLDHCGLGVG